MADPDDQPRDEAYDYFCAACMGITAVVRLLSVDTQIIDPRDLLSLLELYQKGTTPNRAAALTALQVYLDPSGKYYRSSGS